MNEPVPSPCVDVCRMDDAAGICAGCLRTLDEIAAWSLLDDTAKRAVWVELARRRVVWQRLHPAVGAASGAAPGDAEAAP